MPTAPADDWLRRVAAIQRFASGGQRAPHKPLLLLTYLARVQSGAPRIMAYSALEQPLIEALDAFSSTPDARPHYPFKRLENDGLWEIAAERPPLTGAGDLKLGWLRDHDPGAGIPIEDHELLLSTPGLIDRTVRLLLGWHFPPSLWADIVDTTGVEHDLDSLIDIGLSGPLNPRRRRDPRFRATVLTAHRAACVVCGYDGRRRTQPVGLDAAHIRWHTHDGPDDLANGLAMCSLHHVLFDRGMFTYDADQQLRVSPRFQATDAGVLADMHGRRLGPPQQPAPDPRHLAWHRSEVFKDTA